MYVGLIVAALAAWQISLGRIHPSAIKDYGLVATLPFTFYLALALLTVSYSVAVSRKSTPTVLLFHIVAFIVIIHGTTAIVYDAPR